MFIASFSNIWHLIHAIIFSTFRWRWELNPFRAVNLGGSKCECTDCPSNLSSWHNQFKVSSYILVPSWSWSTVSVVGTWNDNKVLYFFACYSRECWCFTIFGYLYPFGHILFLYFFFFKFFVHWGPIRAKLSGPVRRRWHSQILSSSKELMFG
jgi:hypothetical protein